MGQATTDDVYGFSVLGLLDSNSPSVRLLPPYPYVMYVVFFNNVVGKSLARTKMQLPPTPPADLNITSEVHASFWEIRT